MPGPIEMGVIGRGGLAARMGRDHGLRSHLRDRVPDGSPVVGAIPQHAPGFHAHQEAHRVATLVRLARAEHEVHRIAVGIGDQVDLGREPAPRSAKPLRAGPPFAPAACWWARMTVPSSITHSVSASLRSTSRMVCHTPARLQRLKRVKTDAQEPKTSGRSRQGAPVRCFHRMASTKGRLGRLGLPRRPFSGGRRGASLAHIWSLNWLRGIGIPMAIYLGYRALRARTREPFIAWRFWRQALVVPVRPAGAPAPPGLRAGRRGPAWC